jgi:hypothetical protein
VQATWRIIPQNAAGKIRQHHPKRDDKEAAIKAENAAHLATVRGSRWMTTS